MINILIPGENPDLAKAALEKCLNHFKSLTYLEVEKTLLVQDQIKLHESLINGTGKLIYSVSTLRPLDDRPCLRFGVQIGETTEFFQPWLSDQGNEGIDALGKILTDEELYALALDGSQENIAWWRTDLKKSLDNGTSEEDYNGHYTKGSLAQMKINEGIGDLEKIKSSTIEQIRVVMKIGN